MLQIRVDVRFEDLPHVQIGQPVVIESPAIGLPLTGNVLFISSLADIQKNTLEVKVLIDNPPEVFKPEMLVDVTFLAAQVKASAEGGDALNERTRITVPKRLVRDEDGKRVIWIADQSNNVANKAIVETGAISGDWVEVTSGLTITSRLIAKNHDALREGTRIRVVEEDAPASEPDLNNVTPSSSQEASERTK
jgi:HlyD family secretion protein